LFPIAYTLLREFDGNLTPADEKILDLLYHKLPGGHKTVKRTAAGRYRSIDDSVVEEIAKTFPVDRLLRVHDMAASNAITSLEFFERLKHRDNMRFHATDFYDAVHAVSVPESRWKVVFDAEHRPLQFVGSRMVIPATRLKAKERLRYPVNWALQRILSATVLPKALRILQAPMAAEDSRVERIELFHPRCIAAARSDRRFTLGRDNLLKPASGSYEVIRIMGVVRFFPPEWIEPMFRAVSEHVVDGGLLVVGQRPRHYTHVQTTIFQRRGRHFVAIRDLADGHPHRELLLGLELTGDAESAVTAIDRRQSPRPPEATNKAAFPN
jgi:hypothetical protein